FRHAKSLSRPTRADKMGLRCRCSPFAILVFGLLVGLCMRLFHQNNLGVIPDRHTGPADPELALMASTNGIALQRCYPGAVMIVPRKRRPASVGILCVEKKALSAFSAICAPEPELKHRIACRLQCRRRKGRERRQTATRKPCTNKFGGYIAENHKL